MEVRQRWHVREEENPSVRTDEGRESELERMEKRGHGTGGYLTASRVTLCPPTCVMGPVPGRLGLTTDGVYPTPPAPASRSEVALWPTV